MSLDAQIISLVVRKPERLVLLQQQGVTADDLQPPYDRLWGYILRMKRDHGSVPSRAMIEARYDSVHWPRVLERDIPLIVHHLKERTRFNKFLNLLGESARNCAEPEDMEDTLQMLMGELNQLQMSNGQPSLVNIASPEYRAHIVSEITHRRMGRAQGLPTGLPTLDAVTGGLQRQRMVVVIGRTGTGKSWVDLLFVAEAIRSGAKVILYPLEMSLDETAMRLYTIFSQRLFGGSRVLRNLELTKGHVSKRKFLQLLDVLENQFNGQLLISDVGRLNTPYTVERIEAEVEIHQPDMFWVDYLTLLKAPNPGGGADDYNTVRALSSGIKGIATRHNCFAGPTRFLTADGTKNLREMTNSSVKVLGATGSWVDATVESFGTQRLWEVVVRRKDHRMKFLTTKEHRWFIVRRSKGGYAKVEVTTDQLEPGNKLSNNSVKSKGYDLSSWGVSRGITYGDGCVPKGKRSAHTVLCGDKDAQLLKWFPLSPTRQLITGLEVGCLPRYFKHLPSLSESTSYLYGWLAGYFAADGTVGKDGTCRIGSVDKKDIQHVKDVCSLLGIEAGPIGEIVNTSQWAASHVMYTTHLALRSLRRDFFLIDEHLRRWEEAMARPGKISQHWSVDSVRSTNRYEEVFCAVVPNGQAFTLDGNILTGNCVGGCSAQVNREALRVRSFLPRLEHIAYGDCVRGDQIIQTADGMVRLQDAVGVPMKIFDGTGWEEGIITYAGMKQEWEILFEDGSRLIGSKDHKLWAQTGSENFEWSKFTDLQPGDYGLVGGEFEYGIDTVPYLTQYTPKGLGNKDNRGNFVRTRLVNCLTVPLAEVMGLLVGDGALKQNNTWNLALDLKDQDVADYFCQSIYNIFGYLPKLRPSYSSAKCQYAHVNAKGIIHQMVQMGMQRVYSCQRYIPHTILRSTPEMRSAFLRGLFEADGSFNDKCIDLATTSGQLAQEVQLVLRTLGIDSTASCKERRWGMPQSDGYRRSDIWRVRIRKEMWPFFENEIGFISQRKKTLLVQRTEFGKRPHTYSKPFTRGLEPMRIVSVTSTGNMAPMYDVVKAAAGSHKFSLNGFVVHNSIGQDADQVIPINRRGDKLYYALVKNRGGPEIGKVTCDFLVNSGIIREIAEQEDTEDDN